MALTSERGSYVPLAWTCRRQTCVSTSTPEAETISLMNCLKGLTLPAMSLLRNVFDDDVIKARIFEDNSACEIIAKKGTSPALAHMPRTHRISVSWIAELLRHNEVDVATCPTAEMIADIMTKSYPKSKWQQMLSLVRIGPDSVE